MDHADVDLYLTKATAPTSFTNTTNTDMGKSWKRNDAHGEKYRGQRKSKKNNKNNNNRRYDESETRWELMSNNN